MPKQQKETVEKPVSLRDQLKEKNKLIDDVQRRLEEKELEFDKLETNCEDLKARVHDLKGELREQSAQLKVEKQQVSELHSRLETRKQEFRGTQRENFIKILEISFSAFSDCFRAF